MKTIIGSRPVTLRRTKTDRAARAASPKTPQIGSRGTRYRLFCEDDFYPIRIEKVAKTIENPTEPRATCRLRTSLVLAIGLRKRAEVATVLRRGLEDLWDQITKIYPSHLISTTYATRILPGPTLTDRPIRLRSGRGKSDSADCQAYYGAVTGPTRQARPT